MNNSEIIARDVEESLDNKAAAEANPRHIKIHITNPKDEIIAGESVWATDLGNNTARIDNIPFFVDHVGYGDIIKYDIVFGIREFQEIITKVTDSWGVIWEPTDKANTEQTTEEWRKIADHLKSNDVQFESASAGIFVISLPVDQNEKNIIWLKALKYSSPIALTLHFGEDEEADTTEDCLECSSEDIHFIGFIGENLWHCKSCGHTFKQE